MSIGAPVIGATKVEQLWIATVRRLVDTDEATAKPNTTIAEALVVEFDEFIRKLDDSLLTWDEFETTHAAGVKGTVGQLFGLDGKDKVIGTFTGREHQRLRLVVPGDTVKFHLVTDLDLAPLGHRVDRIQRARLRFPDPT